jgi:hypothetical protein
MRSSRPARSIRSYASAAALPAGVLRSRVADVLTPARLARLHPTYRARVLMGPSYRADMWAELERSPSITAPELARRTYGSIATASRVKQDRALWLESEAAAHELP